MVISVGHNADHEIVMSGNEIDGWPPECKRSFRRQVTEVNSGIIAVVVKDSFAAIRHTNPHGDRIRLLDAIRLEEDADNNLGTGRKFFNLPASGGFEPDHGDPHPSGAGMSRMLDVAGWHQSLAEVAVHNLRCRPVFFQPPVLEQNRPRAQIPDGCHVVTHEENRPALLVSCLIHSPEAFLLKGCIPDCKDLVHDEDIRLQVSSHGKCQPHIHAARVALHGRINKLCDLCKFDDPVETGPHLGA